MIAVDGEAARALADDRARALAGRDRRESAAGGGRGRSVAGVARAGVRDVDVGIARTEPAVERRRRRREVEQLYLDMIARARRYIYIENQYFTSQRIAARAREAPAEPDGPEIVLVTRLLSHGWLEEVTMHVLRTR